MSFKRLYLSLDIQLKMLADILDCLYAYIYIYIYLHNVYHEVTHLQELSE